MRRVGFIGVVAVVVFGCGEKKIDLTPKAVHGGVEFAAVPVKPVFKDGERVIIRMEVHNKNNYEVPMFIDWRDPNFGMGLSRTLKSGDKEYELPAMNQNLDTTESGPPIISNLSFMLLGPDQKGLIFAETIGRVKAKGSSDEPSTLPPGEYTFVGEYVVKTPYDATYELGGKRQPLPMDEGDARSFLAKAPRGHWRAECKFTVSTEKAPPPPRRRSGGPSGA